MKTLNFLFAVPLFALATNCSAQLKNARTVDVKIDGDCPMCETRIEAAGSVKGEAEVDWVVETHLARVTYDSTRTDLDAILQRVAHAGYDTERFLAPKEAYDKLPGCCQYDRTLVQKDVNGGAMTGAERHEHHMEKGDDEQAPSVFDKPGYQGTPQKDGPAVQIPVDPIAAEDHLKPVFEAYFTLKDALVASDAKAGMSAAQNLGKALTAVKMETLDHATHMVWMKVMGPLADNAKVIANAKDIDAQRKAFMQLTDPMAQLAKAAPMATPIYLDHCPMYEGGADWLSMEKPIKNPFYGSTMMTCGSVKETIAK